MWTVSNLSTVNALLNGISAILLVIGYCFIRRHRWEAHRAFMLAAFVVSTLFLISYLIYHAHVGSVPFQGQGWIRPVYYAILISHVVLAATVVPLALVTLAQAFRGRFARHRRIARWTFPVWLYVSVTGVLVYVMLYHL
ncbi:MAG: DUF420 domain-containing protein [Anaerolineae bacterium]|nr:DUF420 domain-containing protein [Anaerolineae bacterium]MDW8098944.1 DUF420 domain-containing protein [Anaerolineae bacterium]